MEIWNGRFGKDILTNSEEEVELKKNESKNRIPVALAEANATKQPAKTLKKKKCGNLLSKQNLNAPDVRHTLVRSSSRLPVISAAQETSGSDAKNIRRSSKLREGVSKHASRSKEERFRLTFSFFQTLSRS
nr:hypothetical protein CFP56_76029 [Quercus suber]